MIYSLQFKVETANKGVRYKQMYLSADSKSQVLRRAVSMYAVDPKTIEILEEIDDSNMDMSMPPREVKRQPEKKKEYSEEVISQVDQLISKAYYVGGKDKERLLRDYLQIELNKDLTIRDQMLEICSHGYKKVRLYLEKDGKKGCYKYMILVKEKTK